MQYALVAASLFAAAFAAPGWPAGGEYGGGDWGTTGASTVWVTETATVTDCAKYGATDCTTSTAAPVYSVSIT